MLPLPGLSVDVKKCQAILLACSHDYASIDVHVYQDDRKDPPCSISSPDASRELPHYAILIVQLGFVDVTTFFPSPGLRLLIRLSLLVTYAMYWENGRHIIYITVPGHTLRVFAGLDDETAEKQFSKFKTIMPVFK